MELLEMFGWVVLGFVPALGVLEMASKRLGQKCVLEWSWEECPRNESGEMSQAISRFGPLVLELISIK